MTALAAAAADLWNRNSSVPIERHPCSFVIGSRECPERTSRFAFVSLGTQLELFTGDSLEALDVSASRSKPLDHADMLDRLVRGHVGVVCAGHEPMTGAGELPTEYLEQRDQLRLREVTARQGIQQIGLDQLTSVKGATAELLDMVADLWDTDLAIQIDVAITLTAGADRQRYLDQNYQSLLAISRRSALRALANRSVQSNPLLAL